MITFNYENVTTNIDEASIEKWIQKIISNHNYTVGEINFIFCTDDYLHKLNVEFLQHDTLTDIISFDNTIGKLISGDVFISVERVLENANDYKVSFNEELHRVIIHGVLHYLGYKDKSSIEKSKMREAENNALSLLNN